MGFQGIRVKVMCCRVSSVIAFCAAVSFGACEALALPDCNCTAPGDAELCSSVDPGSAGCWLNDDEDGCETAGFVEVNSLARCDGEGHEGSYCEEFDDICTKDYTCVFDWDPFDENSNPTCTEQPVTNELGEEIESIGTNARSRPCRRPEENPCG